jgi:alkylhydroperoxidase family enzyme
MGTNEVIAAGAAFGLATNSESDVPFRIRELARMRIAQLNGCGL